MNDLLTYFLRDANFDSAIECPTRSRVVIANCLGLGPTRILNRYPTAQEFLGHVVLDGEGTIF